MKRIAVLIVAASFSLVGCTTHYYKIHADMVQFYLKIPDAKIVYFASSLDDFKLRQMQKIDKHTWAVVVPAGFEFKYFYVVDGDVYLPGCKLKAKDDFGSENCIFAQPM